LDTVTGTSTVSPGPATTPATSVTSGERSTASRLSSSTSASVPSVRSRYCAYAPGRATLNGRVCARQRNVSPWRSSSTRQWVLSAEPSSTQSRGASAGATDVSV
jgi:hypothetical protein